MPPARASTDPQPWHTVPLELWEPPHPVTAALLAGSLAMPEPKSHGGALPRSRELATALAACNRRWGNPVDEELELWLSGASVVVAGQQPGLWGGPLLSLVKACAVAAEVARLRAEGKPAVGFFWLETRDDDLPEMGWGRVAVGGELFAAKEGWSRGEACAFAAELSQQATSVLQTIPQEALSLEHSREALAWACECFAPGQFLGEACGRFWGRILRGLVLILVDASLPELAQASAYTAQLLLQKLQPALDCLQTRAQALAASGLPSPLRLRKDQLPFFWLQHGRRQRVPAKDAPQLALELERCAGRVAPNVWSRPLLQDAALGTSTAILGSSELAYHWLAQDLWPLLGIPRPCWQLRPHVTVVGPADRRWAEKLGVAPEELLSVQFPRRLLPALGLAKQWRHLSQRWQEELQGFASKAQEALPNLAGELAATQKKLAATLSWLAQRLEGRAEERAFVASQRFSRLRQSLRPLGQPQERALSALSPLLSLGTSFPLQLSSALRALPWEGMQLLYWREGGLW